MRDPSVHSKSVPGPSLVRDVIVLVLTGLVLGTGYNLLQLRAGDGRGLPWIKTERRLASLESLLPPAAVADSLASSARPSRPVPAGGSNSAATEPPATRPEPVRERGPIATDPPPPADPPAKSAPAAAPAATPAPSAPAAPAPAAPVIPDTREPLEAGDAVVKALHDAGAALFVDARSAEEFAEGHIPGAVNLPFDDVFRRPDLAKALDSGGRPIVAYCGGGDCELSKNLAFALIEGGHRKVLVYRLGTKGWAEAGWPLVKGAPR